MVIMRIKHHMGIGAAAIIIMAIGAIMYPPAETADTGLDEIVRYTVQPLEVAIMIMGLAIVVLVVMVLWLSVRLDRLED